MELLRGHDPKDYERILREHGIHDYRAILQAVEFLKREKEMETGRAVGNEEMMCFIVWVLLQNVAVRVQLSATLTKLSIKHR